ncbi:MAG: zinc ribbon domain-containing protein [Deltaproteobacteria bacterium]|nr:zinc ribbon domain-containing protein [Deltaproteobacteria bacterium]
MKCPKCQSKNIEDAKFCNECGNRLEVVCPECG